MSATGGVSYEVALRLFALPAGISFVLKSDGRIEFMNQDAEGALEYSRQELEGNSILELVHADDRQTFEAALRNAEHALGVEARIRTSRGEYRRVRWTFVPAGERIFARAEDLTESREAPARHYRRIFEYSKEAIVLANVTDGTITECNKHTASMFGYEKADLQGRTISEVALFNHNKVGERTWEAMQRSEVWRVEEHLGKRDGSPIYCELLCNRIEDEGGGLIQIDIRDISDRKPMQALRESEERFRMLVDGVRDYAIFLLDTRGKVSSWSAGAERILQYREEEILGRDVSVLFTAEDRERGVVKAELEQAKEEGRAEDERWHVRKDGTRFFASGVLAALRGPEGEIRGFVKVMRDVTERRNKEEAEHEAKVLESVGMLAGGIAHDFNNLLTGIIGNASLAAEDLLPGDPARRLLDDVIMAGHRAADLTQQLLAYAGKGRFTVSTFDLSDVVGEMLREVHATLPATVQLEIDLQKQLPRIEADPSQVQQIAFNLLINAVEALEGHGTVRVSTGQVRVEEGQASAGWAQIVPGEYVYFQVEDTGRGMEENVKARIFDPFFTTKFTGRGLGLAAVAGFVRAHGGAIQVVTAPGQGSRFRVLLPIKQPTSDTEGRVGSGARRPSAVQGVSRLRAARLSMWDLRAQR